MSVQKPDQKFIEKKKRDGLKKGEGVLENWTDDEKIPSDDERINIDRSILS